MGEVGFECTLEHSSEIGCEETTAGDGVGPVMAGMTGGKERDGIPPVTYPLR